MGFRVMTFLKITVLGGKAENYLNNNKIKIKKIINKIKITVL